MTSEELYKAIGGIDERYVDDRPIGEIKRKTPASLWGKWVSVAACVALVVLGVVRVSVTEPLPADIVYPFENAPTSVVADFACWSLGAVTYYTYADLADKSKAVVVADVEEIFREQDAHSADTVLAYATVRVAEVIKGDIKKEDSLTVQDNGYIQVDKVGNATDVYSRSGGPLMEKGNRVLLFLTVPPSLTSCLSVSEQPYYTLTQSTIGVFFYDEDGRYHAAACYDDHIAARGWMLYDYTPKTLKEIKQNIRQ